MLDLLDKQLLVKSATSSRRGVNHPNSVAQLQAVNGLGHGRAVHAREDRGNAAHRLRVFPDQLGQDARNVGIATNVQIERRGVSLPVFVDRGLVELRL
jgi:hypothetical protein